MTVYIDDMNMEHNGKVWCHMVADTEEELHAFAAKIGLRREWCHISTVFGKPAPHYDLTAERKRQALFIGAEAITTKEALKVIRIMTDAELNEQTLKLLGWRWEPLEGKNAGGELVTPAGTRYQFALNELVAWSIVAPQVATKCCEAEKMLSKYVWNNLHSPHEWGSWHVVTLRAGKFEGKSNTFPRAACLAVCAMLESIAEPMETAGDVE